MKRLFFIILLLPALAFAQFGHVGMSASQMLAIINPAIADSGLFVLDDADTTKPKAGRYLKVPGLLVTGGAKIEGNVDVRGSMTLDTTPVTKLTADSTVSLIGSRNEGGVRAKNTSMFGATTTPVYITSTGKLGIRTATPYASASIVDAAGGSGTGLHLVNSAVNKARTTWATSHDSASIALYTDTDGTPRLSIKAKDGDTLGVYPDGTYAHILTNNYLSIGGTNGGYLSTSSAGQRFGWTSTAFTPTGAQDLGSTSARFRDIYGYNTVNFGGKGKTPVIYVSTENTIAGQDSSIKLSVESGEPVLSLRSSQSNASGTATQNRRLYSGADTTLLVNGAKTGRDSTVFALPDGKLTTTGGLDIATGKALTVGAVQWDAAASDSINGANIAARTITDLMLPATLTAKSGGVSDADYGDVTVSTGAWAVEDDSHNHTSATTKFVINDSARVEKTLLVKGKATFTDDLSYRLRHAFIAFQDSSQTIDVTQNVFARVTNEGDSLFVTEEASFVTVAGDSMTVITPGDYWTDARLEVEGGNGDRFRLALFKNGAEVFSVSAKLASANDSKLLSLAYYLEGLVAGDDLSLRITNLTDSDDPTLTSGTWYLRKEHD